MSQKNDPLIITQIYDCVRCFKIGGYVETENKSVAFFLLFDKLWIANWYHADELEVIN